MQKCKCTRNFAMVKTLIKVKIFCNLVFENYKNQKRNKIYKSEEVHGWQMGGVIRSCRVFYYRMMYKV